MNKKEKVDNSEFYKYTDFPVRDKVYNWIVGRYEKNGHVWKKSDTRIWGGAIYTIWDWAVILGFIYLMWYMFNFMQKRYGDIHAIAFLIIMVLFRLNALIRKVAKLSS